MTLMFTENTLSDKCSIESNAPINVNPVSGGSAGKGWGFDKF